MYQFLWNLVRYVSIQVSKSEPTKSDSVLVTVPILRAIRTIGKMVLEGFTFGLKEFVREIIRNEVDKVTAGKHANLSVLRRPALHKKPEEQYLLRIVIVFFWEWH